MRAQSLYSYFGSKHEIYDAMFAQANHELLEQMTDETDAGGDVEMHLDAARRGAHRFLEFCVNDPVRYQLLFQRTIPDFVPSERSYAVAQEAYGRAFDRLRAIGLDQPAIDLWSAVLAGLVAQQLSNDPSGERWAILVDPAVDMLVAATRPSGIEPQLTRSRR